MGGQGLLWGKIEQISDPRKPLQWEDTNVQVNEH